MTLTMMKLKATSCPSTKLLAAAASSSSLIFGRRPNNYPYRNVAAFAYLRFLKVQETVGASSSVNLSHLASRSRTPIIIVPASSFPSSSSSSQSSQVELEAGNDQLSHQYDSRMVHIKLQLRKECKFGEQFLVVGDDPILGLWDPSNAIPMNWSDGHLWTAELDIPMDKVVQFKFILRRINGEIMWQPGPDRILQPWKTEKLLIVLEDWENEQARLVTEEEDIRNQYKESAVNPEMLIVADNLPHPLDESKTDMVEQLKHSNGNNDEDVIPLNETDKEERSMEISSNQVVAKKVNFHEGKDIVASLSRSLIIKENIIGRNGSNFHDEEVDVHLETLDASVLVPGLPPCSTLSCNDVAVMEEHSKLEPDTTSANTVDAKLDAPEREEVKRYTEKEEESSKLMSNHDLALNDGEELQLLNNKPEQDHRSTNNQAQGEENATKENFVWENDIKWGRETLKKFLSNLRFLGFNN